MNANPDSGPVYAKAPDGVGLDGVGPPATHHDSGELLAAIWRYRWAVIVPAILGAVIGYVRFLKTPETYRSTTRLIVESDRAAILHTMTGDVIGGVPGIELVSSQLFSDRVGEMAFNSPEIQPFHERFDHDLSAFIGVAQRSLKLDSEVTDLRSGQSLVFLMHFESEDRELCQSAVKAYSAALQQHFNERQKSSRTELIRLITVAIEQIDPKMRELEQEYREFRKTAPLAWDANGDAINPHRERQLFLVERRSELVEQLRQKEIETASIEAIVEDSKDAFLALEVVGQILDVSISIPDSESMRESLREGDVELAEIELDQQLVPLIIERNKYAAQFGDSHPTVLQLDGELATMKSELKRLIREQSQRIVELMESGEAEVISPSARANNAINAVIRASKAETALLKKQIESVDKQIASEKLDAINLAQIEQDNNSLIREIDRTRKLMDQLQEQMARVELIEEEGRTRVDELTAPSVAYQIGPNMARLIGLGAFFGLALGACLALLLEKNANTFRDPDEVADYLGVPVLTHVPFFKGRTKRLRKHEDDPFADFDSRLAVVREPSSVAAESIRSCRTSIFFETAGPGGKIIQVTSPLPGDGKSTIAGNLACSIAQTGKRVLAVDCDLRRPQLTDNFTLSDQLGLTNTLNGDCDPLEACHPTPLANLEVMPSGPIPANPAEALTLLEMADLLEHLRQKYDYVIIDTPPLLVVTDPSIVASMVDGVVMAIRVRRKSKPNTRESTNILRAVGARILGVVVNNSDEPSVSDGYRGYGYYHGSGYYRYGRYARRYSRDRNGTTSTSEKKYGRRTTEVIVSGRRVSLSEASTIETRAAADNSIPEDLN